MREDLAEAESAVERLIDVALNDHQFAALVCFTFNLGAGNLSRSTLRRRLNAGDYDAVPSELGRWVKAGGRTLAGLVRRRAAEGELFATPVDAPPEQPLPARGLPVTAVEAGTDEASRPAYLDSVQDLQHGSVDDQGDARYLRLSQNVPDGYVVALQNDLRALGFGPEMSVDGAFGNQTEAAVKRFRKAAGLPAGAVVDQAARDAIALWLKHGYTRRTPPAADTGAGSLVAGHRLVHPRARVSPWSSPTTGGTSTRARSMPISTRTTVTSATAWSGPRPGVSVRARPSG